MSLVFALLHDDALLLRVAPSAARHVDAWLPASARRVVEHVGETVTAPTVDVRSADVAPAHPVFIATGAGVLRAERPAATPTVRLGGVDAYLDDATQSAVLMSRSGHVAGRVCLATCGARIDVVTGVPPARCGDVSSALTLCAALLMNRSGRALVHAGAVAPPGEGATAWLLVGDTHSGKTTTTANLTAAGWAYLSDDHVVLSAPGGGPVVDGWPRSFHLDTGWGTAVPEHRRVPVDPQRIAPARRRPTAALAGVLFPRVCEGEPTGLEPVSATDALAELLRQSPWVMVDRRAAPTALSVLSAAARLPARRLRLGLDTFNDPALLVRRLAPVCLAPTSVHTPDVPGVLHSQPGDEP